MIAKSGLNRIAKSGLNRIAKSGLGLLCLRERNLSFDNNYMR